MMTVAILATLAVHANPYLERPEIATDAGQVANSISPLSSPASRIRRTRLRSGSGFIATPSELKDAGIRGASNLDDNTIVYNDLVQKIQELEDQLACVNLT